MKRRTFFDRFDTSGVCVLPSEALADDQLIDPDTGEIIPSLRSQAGTGGLCYARVLRSCAEGLYWADVAASPQLANAQRVLLTEEDLYSALPYDVRVQGKSSGHLLRMMAAHAQEVRPVQQLELASMSEPAPLVPLAPFATVEVSADELQEVLVPILCDIQTVTKRTGSFIMQQMLLCTMIDTLMRRLYKGQDRVTALYLKARCEVIALLQYWHRQHQGSQRVVNAVPGWSDERQSVVWRLTVGVPIPAPARLAA